MDHATLGRLEEWTGSLDDRDALDRSFDANGYLFLRGVLPREVSRDIRTGIVRALADQGAVVHDAETASVEPPPSGIDADLLHRAAPYQLLWTHPKVLKFMNHFFGGPVFTWRFVALRAKGPGPDAYRAIAHQDGFFYEGEPVFRTFWTPLAPVDPSMGGLAVVPGSHRAGLRDAVSSTEYKMGNVGGGGYRTIAPEQLPTDGWATPGPMEPGDVLVQHPHLVHEGLPNHSVDGRMRLSMDWRVQPASAFRTAASLYQHRDLKAKLEAGEMLIDDRGRYQFHDGYRPADTTEPDRALAV